MSTPNFYTQSSFPLYVYDDSKMEWYEAQDYFNDMEQDLNEANENFKFFHITLRSGYYSGVQLYVELTEEADNAGFTEQGAYYADNDSCRYWLDMCLSEAKRKFGTEMRKVNKEMKKLADAWEFEQYLCIGIFSNGEAVYRKATA